MNIWWEAKGLINDAHGPSNLGKDPSSGGAMAAAARTLRPYGCKKLRLQSIVLLTKIDLD